MRVLVGTLWILFCGEHVQTFEIDIYLGVTLLNHSMGVDTWHLFSSVTQSYPTLCDPMDCSMSGLPVHRQLLEFTQTHIH